MKRQRPTLIALALTAASLAFPCFAFAADSPMKQVNGRLYFGADATVAATRDDYKFVTPYAPGWNMQFGLALNNWALSLGLSAGVYRLSGSSVDGGLQANVSNGDFIIGTTTYARSVDVRHADLVLRFEPQWILFRPFVEATIGTAYGSVEQHRHSSVHARLKLAHRSSDHCCGCCVGHGVPRPTRLLQLATFSIHAKSCAFS